MSFEQLGLDPRLLKAVVKSGFHQPTDIQSRAIPSILAGRDLMACAQTGTGKTAAFVLPILQMLLEPCGKRGAGPRALVLTPTRELAIQIGEAIEQLGRYCNLSSGSLVGGVSYGPQHRLLGKPLDILVATPGRLLDHIGQGRVDFSRLEVFVLDEADRMLDMGFIRPVKTIAAALPARRQTLLFSATLEGEVLKVAKALMSDPERIQLAVNRDTHADIAQHMHQADDVAHKRRLLAHYLAQPAVTQALVFTATKHGAKRMAKSLDAEGHSTAALHGNMSQAARKRTVEQMRRGEVRVLVATDVAARGLDIRTISHVINFDLPTVAEDYIHRIGRTGRARATGTAVSLVTPEDRSKLFQIERLTGRSLERGIVVGLEPASGGDRQGGQRQREGSGAKVAARGVPGKSGKTTARLGAPGKPHSSRKRSARGRPWTGRPSARREAFSR
ncbi:MAG: DEAD/DEAH box helicase [Arenicellales bacterium]